MAKVTKSLLKSIVKECLVEILSEGLASDASLALNESAFERDQRPKAKKKPRTTPRRPALDSIQYNNRVTEQVNSLTSDPVMSEIFRDTANTTLLEQVDTKKGGYVPADGAARMAHDNNPEDMFTGAGNWAALAFSDPVKK